MVGSLQIVEIVFVLPQFVMNETVGTSIALNCLVASCQLVALCGLMGVLFCVSMKIQEKILVWALFICCWPCFFGRDEVVDLWWWSVIEFNVNLEFYMYFLVCFILFLQYSVLS